MKHILPIIPILLLALAFASCHHGERQTLRSALQMAYADPDSALTMLHTIDRRALPPAEKAYYALTYYLAQNKSGLDVANDSLIRVAYNYYAKLPEDSLYARCMYYMGGVLFLERQSGACKLLPQRGSTGCESTKRHGYAMSDLVQKLMGGAQVQCSIGAEIRQSGLGIISQVQSGYAVEHDLLYSFERRVRNALRQKPRGSQWLQGGRTTGSLVGRLRHIV